MLDEPILCDVTEEVSALLVDTLVSLAPRDRQIFLICFKNLGFLKLQIFQIKFGLELLVNSGFPVSFSLSHHT